MDSMQLEEKEIGIDTLFFAAISGVLLTAGFPKTEMHWAAWFALVPLLFSIRNLSSKRSFLIGFFAGFIHNMTLIYWVSYAMNTFGNLPWSISVAGLILLSAYLALYLAVFSLSVTWLCARSPTRFLLLPFLWVSLEYIRSFLFSGFPWALLGYSQYKNLRLIQLSDISGVYGVSFLIAVVNGSLFLIWLHLKDRYWQGKKIGKILAFGSMAACAALFCLAWFYGGWRVASLEEPIESAPLVTVTVVQGNIEQSQKWNPAFQIETVQKYVALSLSAKSHFPALVVWPETATPFYFLLDPQLTEMVTEGIRETDADFLIGSPFYLQKGKHTDYYNRAYLISPKATIIGTYDKVHLVPFGEYVPLKKWLFFLEKVVEEVGDFVSGIPGKPISWGPCALGVQICYEIIFPSLSRAMVQNGAGLLINLTNDAWYGRSSAPYQHFSMTLFRAVENRRSLIRSANTGISGFVDPAGRIIASTPLFQDAVITQKVPVVDLTTFYTRFGDVFAGVCLAVTFLGFLMNTVKKFQINPLT